jgi:hypothetical protein
VGLADPSFKIPMITFIDLARQAAALFVPQTTAALERWNEVKQAAEPHSGCASIMAGRDLAEVNCQRKPGTTIIMAMFFDRSDTGRASPSR